MTRDNHKQITDAERIAATLKLGLKSTVDEDGRVKMYNRSEFPIVTRSWNATYYEPLYTTTFVTDCPDWRKSMVGGE